MITRGKRRDALKKALQKSQNGEVTYVLISDNSILITQDEEVAKTYVHSHGYSIYAKCKDSRVAFSET